MNLVFAVLTAILFARNQLAILFNSWFTYVVSSFRFFPLPRHAASSANNTEGQPEVVYVAQKKNGPKNTALYY